MANPMRRTALSIIVSTLLLSAASPAVAAPNLPETRQLSLAQALDLADRENPDLAGRRARIEQADAAARQALSAVLPIVKASANYTLNNQDARVGVPGGGELVLQPRDSVSASTSVQVPLFAQNAYSDIARARELGRAERWGYEGDRQRLRGAVVRACWLLESAHSIVRVAEQGVASATQHRDSTRRAADAGTATPLAVLQAESDLVQRRGTLTEAYAGVAQAELALGVLLGRAEPVRVEVPPIEQGAENLAPTARLVDEALRARHEVAQRSSELRASEHAVTSAAYRFLPALSGSVTAFASDQPYVTGEQQGWRASLDLTWTLYDGGYRYGKRQEAVAQKELAVAADRSTRLSISKEVQEAVLDVRVARERVVASTEESRAADETARAAERSFAAGRATSLDVIDALDRQTQAAVGLERARADLGIAVAELRTARGIAW
jgi:outer membrane protein TolC